MSDVRLSKDSNPINNSNYNTNIFETVLWPTLELGSFYYRAKICEKLIGYLEILFYLVVMNHRKSQYATLTPQLPPFKMKSDR
jgi:hypothetical protein